MNPGPSAALEASPTEQLIGEIERELEIEAGASAGTDPIGDGLLGPVGVHAFGDGPPPPQF